MINTYIPNTTIFQKDLLNIYDVNDTSREKDKSSEGINTGFTDIMKEEIQKVNDKQVEADDSITGYLAGDKNINEVMLATEEASMSLELAIQIRNKLVDAYKEFNNMQV